MGEGYIGHIIAQRTVLVHTQIIYCPQYSLLDVFRHLILAYQGIQDLHLFRHGHSEGRQGSVHLFREVHGLLVHLAESPFHRYQVRVLVAFSAPCAVGASSAGRAFPLPCGHGYGLPAAARPPDVLNGHVQLLAVGRFVPYGEKTVNHGRTAPVLGLLRPGHSRPYPGPAS